MADPPIVNPDPNAINAGTEAINAQTTALGNLTTATQGQDHAFHALNSVGTLVQTSMQQIEDIAKAVGVSFNDLSSLTGQQIEQFGMLSTAIVNARDAFTGFTNVDYSGLTTFSDQIKVIRDALENTPASKAADAIKMLGTSLLNAGVPQSTFAAAAAKSKEAVIQLAESTFKHADNMLRAQTAYVQMAARTGELGDVQRAAGKDFKDLGTIIESQQTLLRNAREATGLTAAQTERWYNQLGLIPGALTAVTETAEKGGRTMSMLTAAIETAVGTGRSQDDVMKDLNIAFKDYGLVGEKALLFSVRMSDVSTRLKAPIEDVTSALRSSADAFKMFSTGQESASRASEGLAETLNTYGKALESTGLSASQSIDIIGQMTNQVAKLTIGQKAFISQQTGGPGGLSGAFRIEQRLQQGDTAGVVNDALKAIENQMGKLVSVDQAARDEGAANQLVKQTALLQQLLGPMVKDQQTAEKLIQARINQQAGVPDAIKEALKPTGVQDAAQKGLALQAKSNSTLTTIANTLEQIRDLGDTAGGRMAARVTAGATNQTRTAAQGELSAHLADMARAARERSGSQVAGFARGLETGKVKETAGLDYAAALHSTLGAVKDIPTALQATFDTLKGAFSKGDQDSIAQQEKILAELVQSRRHQADMLKGNDKAQAQAMREANAAQALLDAATGIRGSTAANIGAPGRQVGAAARAAATIPGQAASHQPATTTRQGPGANVGGAPQTINIVGKFTIDCPTCGRPHDVSPQTQITPQQFNQ
jgi:hypothetical protein